MTVKGLTNNVQGLNTGKYEESLESGLVVSGMFVPYDWNLPVAVGDSDVTILANLETSLTGLLINDNYGSRGFYVGPFEAFTDKSEATTYQTLGYGRKVKTQRQINTKEYQILEGGLQYWRSIQTFTGNITQYKWIEFDNQGVVYGTNYKNTATGVVLGMQGIRLSALEPQDRKQANKSTVEERILNMTFQNGGEVNEDLFTIETGIDIDSLIADIGVQDVTMQPFGVMVAHVVGLRVLSADGGVDICVTLPLLLAAANLVATNAVTGVAVGITSAAVVGNKLNITFNTSSAGWSVGTKVNIGLAAVSVLATAGFEWYECASAQAIAVSVMVA